MNQKPSQAKALHFIAREQPSHPRRLWLLPVAIGFLFLIAFLLVKYLPCEPVTALGVAGMVRKRGAGLCEVCGKHLESVGYSRCSAHAARPIVSVEPRGKVIRGSELDDVTEDRRIIGGQW